MTKEEYLEMVRRHPGNNEIYSAANAEVNENSPLKGKKIIFLGSSVTFGAASLEESFIEYLQKEDGILPYKEAVSGTSLADICEGSYPQRLLTIPKDFEADAFVCQLSTNDVRLGAEFGTIGTYDTKTIAGAIEEILRYAEETWHCPLYFYTGTKFDSEGYQKMVDLLFEIRKHHDFTIIDLWNDPMNDIDRETYDLYMADGVHPVRAGYKLWWTPVIRKYLIDTL